MKRIVSSIIIIMMFGTSAYSGEWVQLWTYNPGATLTGWIDNYGQFKGCGDRNSCRGALEEKLVFFENHAEKTCDSQGGSLTCSRGEVKETTTSTGKGWSITGGIQSSCSKYVL